jgi:pyruvate/2-oxoglutarate dehydrogenase complex dihydrolipoamide dehydrogenase (E3) component
MNAGMPTGYVQTSAAPAGGLDAVPVGTGRQAMEHFDAIVLGMGPGGEVVASRLLAAGQKVAVVERELIGGECAYWACIPSKTLLRPPEASSGVRRSAGVDGATLDWPSARDYRDSMIRHLDDSRQVESYRDQGATVLTGTGRVTGPGTVEVDGQRVTGDHIIIATGSDASVPPVEGIDAADVWTNREATTLTEVPRRVVMVGGSAVGVELGQMLARFGSHVTVLERSDNLLSREDPRVGELIGEQLGKDGVDVRTGTSAARVRRDTDGITVALDDDTEVTCDVIVVGTGRRPRTADLGLQTIGVDLGERGEIPVDERCRVTEGVWAIGDVTGIMPFTHVAKYQARVVADTILGRPRSASYDGIPRVVFTDPEVAAVGLTRRQADEAGHDVESVELDLAAALARPWTYEQEPEGHLGLLVDTSRRVLLGAWAVAPQAGEWIHEAALAIRTSIGIDELLDQVAQFPTYSEGFLDALEKLEQPARQ